MVVYVEGVETSRKAEKESAVIRWIFKNPIAAARLILQLMPEGTWDAEEEDGRSWS